MSPRKLIPRKISSTPKIKGFKPYGVSEDLENLEVIALHFEEYEALKMCDYDLLNHCDAAEIMNISRPTFTRIYAIARQKVAKALVEGSQICIEGGENYFDSDWYQCSSCPSLFDNPNKDTESDICPICCCKKIRRFNNGQE
ncbi:MAG: hypothetical protein H6Q25_177 [Bacteroidetes bacterium]|nr:hypothetical protein [Bacteroidota bacterium]